MNLYGYDVPHLPMDWLATLATSQPRLWMYGLDSVHGAFRLAHLLGAGAFLGTVLLLNLRQLGFVSGDWQPMRPALLHVLEAAFWTTIASGVLLFLYDPLGIGLHTMFLPKLILTVAGFIQAKWPWRTRGALLRPGFAASSLAIWFLVMLCSTWNHIEHPRNPGDRFRWEPGRERGV